VRVFWNWYNPENKENGDKVVWEAPKNARWYFGNTRSLYKMYFTSEMRDPKETADQSACVRFGRDFLPEVNKALAEVQLGVPGADQGGKPVEQATPPVSSVDAEKAAIKEAKEAAPADTGGAGPVESGLIGTEKAEPQAK
jgi:hypothetical protein